MSELPQNQTSATDEKTVTSEQARPLRLWLAFVIVTIQLFIMFGPGLLADLNSMATVGGNNVEVQRSIVDNPQMILNSKLLGPLIGTLLLLVWWIAFSGASWISRLAGPVFLVGIGWATWQFIHSTMLFAFVMFIVPSATAAGIAALFLARKVTYRRRQLIALCVVMITFGLWTLVRMDGVDGNLNAQFNWRWASTPEEEFMLAQNEASQVGEDPIAGSFALADTDWPEFRGRRRDGIIPIGKIRADWSGEGLPEVWRRKIGPGWSSFAVVGDVLFTQEQRGEFEVISAYDAKTGNELWAQKDPSRFTEFISGVGPRATPTFSDGRLYATGASGAIHCLDPNNGNVIWRRDLVQDTGAVTPMWGFSSSPLVLDGLVFVISCAGNGNSLIAYDAKSGEIGWKSGNGYFSYSSVHPVQLQGIPQILMMTEHGLVSFEPKSGEQLWLHKWPLGGNSARIIQPAVIGNDIVIGTGYGMGTRRISVELQDGKWSTQEVWTSHALKPYFNDFVIQGNFAFGFDKNIMACIDLETGKRMWKQGRYGHGQVLLLAEQKLLIILSEKGELVLLEANPNEHVELHRISRRGRQDVEPSGHLKAKTLRSQRR